MTKHTGLPEREILVLQCGYYDFQTPPYMASRQQLITRIAVASTLFSFLQCQAWHGYRVASAHIVEVEVALMGMRAHPPSGTAAASPPAGAPIRALHVTYVIALEQPLKLESTVAWVASSPTVLYERTQTSPQTRCARFPMVDYHCRRILIAAASQPNLLCPNK
jgi:hypothetical protein